MTDELVDIIDYKGDFTGQTIYKKLAHKEGLPHWIIAVLVFNPKGQLIVQHHKNADYRLDNSAGGHIESGEDIVDAAKRELKEELGLETNLDFIDSIVHSKGHYDTYDPKIRHAFKVFTTKVPEGWKFVPHEEVDKVSVMDLEEVVELMNKSPEKFVTGFFTTMAAYLKSIGSDSKIITYGKDWGRI